MNITFRKLDEKIPLIDTPAKKIVECVLNSNVDLFLVFANVLLGCHKYKPNTFVNEKIVKKLDEHKLLYTHIASEIDSLKDLMWQYFSYVDDFEFEAALRTNSEHYGDIKTEQQKLDKLRGSLFEVLVEEIVRIRYREEEFNTGCVVIINGKEIISYYDGNARKTIDIAACSEKGEFYECKLSPRALDAKSYVYINLLENELSKMADFQKIIGCVTIGEKLALENEKIRIEAELGITNPNIMLFGRNEILQLKKTPFDDIV